MYVILSSRLEIFRRRFFGLRCHLVEPWGASLALFEPVVDDEVDVGVKAETFYFDLE